MRSLVGARVKTAPVMLAPIIVADLATLGYRGRLKVEIQSAPEKT